MRPMPAAYAKWVVTNQPLDALRRRGAPQIGTQLRLGARKSKGIPQNKPQNASEWFAQWHASF